MYRTDDFWFFLCFKINKIILSLQYFKQQPTTRGMKISEARFTGSSTKVEQKPKELLPEFAFIGRSNVGKSSLINALCGNSKLAMTSSKPGKTRVVNHFRINGQWYLVDLPGYGFAKASQSERRQIVDVIRNYLNFSQELKRLFILIDSRHDLTTTDASFLREMGTSDIPFSIIFTKADKQGPVATARQTGRCMAQIAQVLGCTAEQAPEHFVSSAETGAGRDDILDFIAEELKEQK